MKIRPFYNNGLIYFVLCTLIFTMSILGPDNICIDVPHIVFYNITPTTIVAIMIITVLINRFRGEYDNDIVRGSACFAISMLIQGLAEIVLFTSTHDFFFWFILGIAMKEVKLYIGCR